MAQRVARALFSIVFFASLGAIASGGALLLTPQPALAAIECDCRNLNSQEMSAFQVTYCGFKCTATEAQLPLSDQPDLDPQTALVQIVGRIANALLALLGVVFSVIVIYAGILWMTSAGEEEKVQKAQKLITAGVIGLIITMGSFVFVNFIIAKVIGAIVA
ncbi:MAG: pilin [bacterium]|nr:pilin [bacterium]